MKKNLFMGVAIIGMVFSMASCNEAEHGPKSSDVTIKSKSTMVLNGANWSSENPIIAKVQNGELKAAHVGETLISNADQFMRVIVEPVYRIYSEPTLCWGASELQMRKVLSDCSISKSEGVVNYRVGNIDYNFNKDGLVTASVALDEATISIDELSSFLNERYIYVSASDDIIVMKTLDGKTKLQISLVQLQGAKQFVITYSAIENNQVESVISHNIGLKKRPTTTNPAYGQMKAQVSSDSDDSSSDDSESDDNKPGADDKPGTEKTTGRDK